MSMLRYVQLIEQKDTDSLASEASPNIAEMTFRFGDFDAAYGGADGWNLLHFAAQHNCPGAIPILLENGVDPAAKESMNGRSPLHIAAIRNHHEVVLAMVENEKCADVINATTRDNETPIFLAGMNGSLKSFRILYDHGGDLEIGFISKRNKDNRLEESLLAKLSTARENRTRMMDEVMKLRPQMANQRMPGGMRNILEYAVKNGKYENIEYLCRQTHYRWSKIDYERAMEYAIRVASFEAAWLVLSRWAGHNEGVLFEQSYQDLLRNRGKVTSMVAGMQKELSENGHSNRYQVLRDWVFEDIENKVPMSDLHASAVLMFARQNGRTDTRLREDYRQFWEKLEEGSRAVLAGLAADEEPDGIAWFLNYICYSQIWMEPNYEQSLADSSPESETDEDEADFGEIRGVQSQYEASLVKWIMEEMQPAEPIGGDEVGSIEEECQLWKSNFNLSEFKGPKMREVVPGLFVRKLPPREAVIYGDLKETEDEPGAADDAEEIATRFVRQDDLELGIKSVMDEMTAPNEAPPSDELLYQYDRHVYLGRLIGLAHAIYDEWSDAMTELVTDAMGHPETYLKLADVKTVVSAQEKLGRKYHDERFFPKSARIADALKCRIRFGSPANFVTKLKKLRDAILAKKQLFEAATPEEKESGIVDVLRVSHIFFEDSQEFADLKMSLVYYSKMYQKTIIFEVQCVLSRYLKMSKYKRRMHFVQRINRDRKKRLFEIMQVDYQSNAMYQSIRHDDALGVCNALLLGFKMDKLDKRKQTALMYAADNGAVRSLRILLKQPGAVDIVLKRCKRGRDALFRASLGGYLECVREIERFLEENRNDLSVRGMYESMDRASISGTDEVKVLFRDFRPFMDELEMELENDY